MIFSDATRADVWAKQCSATQIQKDQDCSKEENMVLVAERTEEEDVV